MEKKLFFVFFLLCIIYVIRIYLYTSIVEKFENKNCIVRYSNGKKVLSIDSDLPCSSEIPNPYISNTVTYKKNDTIRILSGYKNSTNYRICEIFSKYSNNVDINNIESSNNYNNIKRLLNGEAEIAFCSEDVLFDYMNNLNAFKDYNLENKKIEELDFICSLHNQYFMLLVQKNSNINTIYDMYNKKFLLLDEFYYFERILKMLNVSMKKLEYSTIINYEKYDVKKEYTRAELQSYDGYFTVNGYDKNIFKFITENIECKFVDFSTVPKEIINFYCPLLTKTTFDTTLFLDYSDTNIESRYITSYMSRTIIISRKDTDKKKIIKFLNFIYNFIVSYRNFEIKPDFYNEKKPSYNIKSNKYTGNNVNFDQISVKRVSIDSNSDSNTYIKLDKKNNYTPIDELSVGNLIYCDITIPLNNAASIFYEKLGYSTTNTNRACSLIAGKYECTDKNLDAINIAELDILFTDDSNKSEKKVERPKSTLWKDTFLNTTYDSKKINDINECCYIKNGDRYRDEKIGIDYTLEQLIKNNLIDKRTLDVYHKNYINICNNKTGNSNMKTSNNIVKNKCKNLENYRDEKSIQNYKCIDGVGFNKLICESDIGVDGIPKKAGVWDKQCVYNEDCPFYNKNTNYTNQRGGCNNGYCEMPINVKRLGFTKYLNRTNKDTYDKNNENTEPYCYNCNDESKNRCCENQKIPDYAFINDLKERYEKREEIEKKGLKWYNYD
jgi:TRAP-type uncharacterized transport system substrate-binding protein